MGMGQCSKTNLSTKLCRNQFWCRNKLMVHFIFNYMSGQPFSWVKAKTGNTEEVAKLLNTSSSSSPSWWLMAVWWCEHEPHLFTGNWFGVYGILSALQRVRGLVLVAAASTDLCWANNASWIINISSVNQHLFLYDSTKVNTICWQQRHKAPQKMTFDHDKQTKMC